MATGKAPAGKPRVLVFGGTSEGRELVEWLSALGEHDVTVCAATEYGGELVSGLDGVRVVQGRLDGVQMLALMRELGAGALTVVDATPAPLLMASVFVFGVTVAVTVASAVMLVTVSTPAVCVAVTVAGHVQVGFS